MARAKQTEKKEIIPKRKKLSANGRRKMHAGKPNAKRSLF